MLDTTNGCGVLGRHTGNECGAPAAALVSHNSRALTFHVCARHAADYREPTWTVTYLAKPLDYSGVVGAGFKTQAPERTLQALAILRDGDLL